MDEACAQKGVYAQSPAMNVAVTKIYTAGSMIILFWEVEQWETKKNNH